MLQPDLNQDSSNVPNSTRAFDFIDPLFAIVLSLALAKFGHSNWFSTPSLLFESKDELFQMLTGLYGITVLILSWLWYHIALDVTDHGLGSWRGSAMFIFDIVIVITYWLMLDRFAEIQAVMALSAVVYLFYYIWVKLHDGELITFRFRAHRSELVAFVLYGALFFVLKSFEDTAAKSPTNIEWIVLCVAIIGLLSYRASVFIRLQSGTEPQARR